MEDYPIFEFDPDQSAIIEPRAYATEYPIPEGMVLCFFHEVLQKLAEAEILTVLGYLRSENGPMPIYQLDASGQKLTVMNPFVGAPIAAGDLEELIAHGGKNGIAEGVSYHYLPPSREAQAHPKAVQVIVDVLQQKNLPFVLGKTWTTSAFYRETVARREKRLKEGCVVVEMEAAAFFAVAQFRQVPFGQLLYAGDLVVPEGWDGRRWNTRFEHRENLFWLAVEACLKLGKHIAAESD